NIPTEISKRECASWFAAVSWSAHRIFQAFAAADTAKIPKKTPVSSSHNAPDALASGPHNASPNRLPPSFSPCPVTCTLPAIAAPASDFRWTNNFEAHGAKKYGEICLDGLWTVLCDPRPSRLVRQTYRPRRIARAPSRRRLGRPPYGRLETHNSIFLHTNQIS